MAAIEACRAEGAQLLGSAVEIDSIILQVRVGALNTLARARGIRVGVIETAQPQSADIGGEGPFSNPDVVFDIVGVAHGAAILITVSANIVVLATPGEVSMGIHDNILMIIVQEEIVPQIAIKVESVVEDELETRLLFLHHLSHISVEALQYVKIR